MPDQEDTQTGRRVPALRADAVRNRERVLLAARDLFVERGPRAPLDEIARRAGVGPATLYRHFPARPALIRAVAMDIVGKVAEAAEQALTQAPTPFDSLAWYMVRAVEIRVAAVMPLIVTDVDRDDEFLALRRRSGEAVNRLITGAHEAGQLRPDVTFGDINGLVSRFSRPLPAVFDQEADLDQARRHLAIVMDGLRTGSAGSSQSLPGVGMTLDDVRRIEPRSSP